MRKHASSLFVVLDSSETEASGTQGDDAGIDQMLAGLEGLTDQEVNALLGEENEIETAG